jgi:hypothetical protein
VVIIESGGSRAFATVAAPIERDLILVKCAAPLAAYAFIGADAEDT